jgi:hypothetical protein
LYLIIGTLVALAIPTKINKYYGETMKKISIVKTALKLALLGAAGFLVACSSSSDDPVASTDSSISGTIVAAPVNGADVSVLDGNGNVVAGPVKTNDAGEYTLSIPNTSLAQDLIVKSTGGTFTDEATGNPGTAGEMIAYASASSLSNGSSVSATPGSTIIAHLVMNHSKTMTQAQDAFASAFGYTPDMSVTPADATTAPAADETMESTLAGFRAGAFSQLAMDLGLSPNDQFALFAALAQDLSDDKLDGVAASSAVAIGTTGSTLEADIQNRFAMALVNFSNNTNNLTALNDAQIGNLPFAKVALTTNYKIEYIQMGMMGPMEGKSTFQIHVTNRSDGSNAPALSTMLMPVMNMAAHHHSTPMPVPAVSYDGNGLYTVTLYYLMPSQMMDGTSMGYWDLKFTVADEEAHFYPAVMMAMGDTPKVVLKGLYDADPTVGDTIAGMLGDMSRNYILFNESLAPAGMGSSTYTFKMFIAAMESMMKYPPVYVNAVLNLGDLDHELTVNTMTVEVSTAVAPTAPSDWKMADEDPSGSGYWSATGLTGLVDGTEGKIHVRLTVNGELKTTDGMAPSGTNEYTTYTVTPGGM